MEYDEAWKELFFDDKETKRALGSSEVFQNYLSGELRREQLRNDPIRKAEKLADDMIHAEAELDAFQAKVDSSPILKMKLQLAKRALQENPELIKTTDPKFVQGLSLLNLEDE